MKISKHTKKNLKAGIYVISIVLIIIAGFTFLQKYHGSQKAYKEVRIPIDSTSQTLQAFVYMPKDEGKHDAVIFNHGSSGGFPKVSLPAQSQAEYFRDNGYIVIVTMRKGRGTSDGLSLESENKNCDINSWTPGIESAFEDVSAAIEYCKKLENFKKDIILAGVSRGGYLSVAYSAKGKYRKDIKTVINFAGSWVAQEEDQCPVDFNLVSFKELGKLTNIQNIWLYGKHDKFNDDASIVSYYNAFNSYNKNTEFYFYDNVPENGHFLVDYINLWEDDLSRYLNNLKK